MNCIEKGGEEDMACRLCPPPPPWDDALDKSE